MMCVSMDLSGIPNGIVSMHLSGTSYGMYLCRSFSLMLISTKKTLQNPNTCLYSIGNAFTPIYYCLIAPSFSPILLFWNYLEGMPLKSSLFTMLLILSLSLPPLDALLCDLEYIPSGFIQPFTFQEFSYFNNYSFLYSTLLLPYVIISSKIAMYLLIGAFFFF